MPARWHLAQVNIGRARGAITDPVMQGFVARLDEINALAERSLGFVWRLQTEDGNATAFRPYPDDNSILINMSVWSRPRLAAGVCLPNRPRGGDAARREWFEKFEGCTWPSGGFPPATARRWRRRWAASPTSSPTAPRRSPSALRSRSTPRAVPSLASGRLTTTPARRRDDSSRAGLERRQGQQPRPGSAPARDPAVEVVALITTVTARLRPDQHAWRPACRARGPGRGARPAAGRGDDPRRRQQRDLRGGVRRRAGGGAAGAAGRSGTLAFGDLFLADVRAYREALLARLGWTPVFPLWGQDTARAGAATSSTPAIEAILTCVDTTQLDAEFRRPGVRRRASARLAGRRDPCGETRRVSYLCLRRTDLPPAAPAGAGRAGPARRPLRVLRPDSVGGGKAARRQGGKAVRR